LITGATPTTVTVKEHCAVKPAPSVTVCVTVVVPIGKVDPLAKPPVLTVVAPEQLSVPTGAVYVTTAPAALVAITEIFDVHEITGGVASSTVTVNEQFDVPTALVAVAVTVVFQQQRNYPAQ
jgi:hypothetical protein